MNTLIKPPCTNNGRTSDKVADAYLASLTVSNTPTSNTPVSNAPAETNTPTYRKSTVYIDARMKNQTRCEHIILDGRPITVSNATVVDKDDWGDEDCSKIVTMLSKATVKISAEVADRFKDVVHIDFIRYNYYSPAYHLCCKMQSMTKADDGALIIEFA